MNESKLWRSHAAAIAAFNESEHKEDDKSSPLKAEIGSRIWFKDRYNGNEFLGTVIDYGTHDGQYYWYKARVDKVISAPRELDDAVGYVISVDEIEVVEYEQ